MKKILLFMIMALFLVSCNDKNDDKKLYIYNWAEYIPTSVYDDFEKETGIKVIEDTYSTNEELFTKLKAGGDGYDIVIPSADYYEIMMKEDMLLKLDKSKISTLKNIDPIIMERIREFDKNNDYGVPYMIGPTIIAVNKKYVKDYPRDFSIFEKSEYKGKMTLLDDMREVMTSALAMDGEPQTTKDEAAIAKAAERIKIWKSNITKFDSESFGKGFANGDFWIVHGYIDNISREVDKDALKDVDFIIPEKGGTAYIDSMVILKNAPDKDNAYKLIEFIHRPEEYAKIADYLMGASINVPARKLMETTPLYQIEDLKNVQILRDINDTLELQSKYWQRILLSD